MATIGIDLGTTNSLVSVWNEGKVKLIPNEFGEYLTPSVVSVTNDNIYVGKAAVEMLITNPSATFREFKREMGNETFYTANQKTFKPEELSAFVLKKLKEDAERALGEPVTDAVISVPAYFTDKQRNATRTAGKIAGLHVDRIINEPSAAVLAYHMEHPVEYGKYLVFDFGGGTLDLSVVEVFDNIVEIKAVTGDNELGGKDFNEEIAKFIVSQIGRNSSGLTSEEKEIIYYEAECIKKELTYEKEVTRSFVLSDEKYTISLSNNELKNLAKDVFLRMLKPINEIMTMERAEPEDFDQVLLIGGSTKMPLVKSFLTSIFHDKVYTDLNPDEIVGVGAGVSAAIKDRKEGYKDMMMADICPFSLGIGIINDEFSIIIPKNSPLPIRKTGIYTTVRDNQEEIKLIVYQGEKIFAHQNKALGEYMIKIPAASRGMVQVAVTFLYDINGIFDMEVECLNNGKKETFTLVNSMNTLTEEQIEALREKIKRENTNFLENMDYQVFRANKIAKLIGSDERAVLAEAVRKYQDKVRQVAGKEKREVILAFSLYLSQFESGSSNIDLSDFFEKDE